ncbi:leukotriene A-4 hydrolase-like [Physella acuta]|uniref:leukotriene A-4 hydrolase-like n=1 Tax=Physella acuta TaxID=109671 RepID=UPI0027DBCAD5|nr:leukotriene A-4 hydrolase-like [Physella acuta]
MALRGPSDPTSYTEFDKCAVTKLDWDVKVDFDSHKIGGFAHLTIEKKTEDLDFLCLDIRDLTIEQVTLQDTGAECEFQISNPLNFTYGSKLAIKLGQISGKSFTVSIKYATSSESTALQWLRPEQTAGKRHPYLFSQCQAIHARSLYPCQDTPLVKFSYTAKVRAPKEFTVLMSAQRLGVEPVEGTSDCVTRFSLNVPIPSYLLAIVAADLESREVGPRSKVWSEREVVDDAAKEFGETETMLHTAEQLVGPYLWGIYDMLILPPSFPYGGMENPCLTFVTPTLLAGDRSQADVIAHEISHSWTGNLVTNRTFEDFWLNEGHTMFLERKILGRMHGELFRQLHAQEGWHTLQKTVAKLTSAGDERFTKLVPDLSGVDPDDAFSSIPYEKGFALLYYLETLLGGPDAFEKFLRAYVDHFKNQSIGTQQWKDFLYQYFSSKEDQEKLNSVDWEAWLYGVGLPPYEPHYDTSLANPSTELCNKWLAQPEDNLDVFSPSDINNLPSILIEAFLSQLLLAVPAVSLNKVQHLQKVYNFNQVRNSEVRLKWLTLCIKARWEDCIPHVLKFLNEQGRMKFVRPLYSDLYAWEFARPKAIENFKAHRAEMHNTTATMVAKDLHLKDQ